MSLLIGLDIGGTKSECCLIKFESQTKFEIIARERIKTDRSLGYEKVLSNIANLIKTVLDISKKEITEIDGIGAGLPGTIDPLNQKMLNGNTGIFIGKDFVTDLKKAIHYKGPVYAENDANLFAFAESFVGAGADYDLPFKQQVSIGIILGTGVGGGLIINGNILQGKNGGGGEIGHTELIANGLSCYCGAKGCAEQYLSGTGIEAHYQSRMYSQIKERPNSKDIFELAQTHEPLAMAVINQYQDHLVKFLTNLTNIFNPHYFVLGGGVSNQELIYNGLEEKLYRQTFIKSATPRVFKNKLGDSSGVIGAALLPLIKKA